MGKKSFLLLEIFIWILILGGLVFLGVHLIKSQLDSHTTYHVEFKDVDSLSVGAPVRIMGIQVGHVVETKPVEDTVYVSFVITNDQVKIPPGSNVSIQFTGLAGSKSIEIEPPKVKSADSQPIHVVETIRVNSLMGLQTSISESILDTMRNTLEIFGKGEVENLRNNIRKTASSTAVVDDSLKKIEVGMESTNKTIKKNTVVARQFFAEQDKNINETYDLLTKQKVGNQVRNTIKSVNASIKGMSDSLEATAANNINKQIATNVNDLNKSVKDMGKQAKNSSSFAQDFKSNAYKTTNDALNGISQFFASVKGFFTPQGVGTLRKQTQETKDTTKKLNEKI